MKAKRFTRFKGRFSLNENPVFSHKISKNIYITYFIGIKLHDQFNCLIESVINSNEYKVFS
jgi:hypothetical protein